MNLRLTVKQISVQPVAQRLRLPPSLSSKGDADQRDEAPNPPKNDAGLLFLMRACQVTPPVFEVLSLIIVFFFF